MGHSVMEHVLTALWLTGMGADYKRKVNYN